MDVPHQGTARRKPRPVDARTGVWLLQLVGLLAIAQLTVFHQEIGAGLAVFMTALSVVVAVKYRNRNALLWGCAALAGILLIVESADFLTILLAIVFLGLFALGRADRLLDEDWRKAGVFLYRYLAGPILAVREIASGLFLAGTWFGGLKTRRHGIRQWIMPVLLVAVFLWLFLPANPWLAVSLAYLDPLRWIALPDISTVLLWLATGLLLWPLLTIEMKRQDGRWRAVKSRTRQARPVFANNRAAVLILFNAVFFLQTLNDMTNLWPGFLLGAGSGTLLPEGKTYAEFAKAGAFPLLAATLLAAAIILALLKDDARKSSGDLVVPLIVLWVLQTILLLASAAARLDLYVDVYGLTRLRLYTFIGMGLIGSGLVLVILRIARNKSNRWLTRRCLLVLTAVAFACGALNLDGYIARKNVERAKFASEDARSLDALLSSVDIDYLCQLGDGALIAIATFIDDNKHVDLWTTRLGDCFRCRYKALERSQSDWHSWSWRGARILRKVTPLLPVADADGNAGAVLNDTVEHGPHSGRR